MSENVWKCYLVEDLFSIDIPSSTQVKFEDDGGMIEFTLPCNPTSQLIAGVFPVRSGSLLHRTDLRLEIERFMVDFAHVKNVNYEVPVDVEDSQVIAYQAVGFAPADRLWLARIYGKIGGNHMMIIHWNSDSIQSHKTVLRAFVSIQILF